MEQESMITMMPNMPEEVEHHHYKTLRIVIGVIVALVIIGGAVWLILKTQVRPPEKVLEQLEEGSRPVAIPTQIRGSELDKLSEDSEPVKSTEQERLDILNMMNQ